MVIRKISVGPDYKNGAMHYILGQKVLNDTQEIYLIKYDNLKQSIKIYIINSNITLFSCNRNKVFRSSCNYS